MMTMKISCSSSPSVNKRRYMEKRRIQQLKSWHEDVKKIAKSEVAFFGKIFEDIFQDDKNSENRDWIRTDEDDDDTQGDGKLVKKDT